MTPGGIRAFVGALLLTAPSALPAQEAGRPESATPAQPQAQARPEAAAGEPRAVDLESLSNQGRGPGAPGGGPASKYRNFAEVTQGADKFDGFFTLYRKDDHLFGEVRPHQFEQPFMAPVTIARGLAQAGVPLSSQGDELILVFRKVGDRVQLIRRNIHYKAPAGTPIEKAVRQNYTDSVLMALPIVSINPMTGGTLIDFNDIFLGDFAQLGLGMFDRNRSTWSKVKAFPNNVELEVEATYAGGGMGRMAGSGDDGLADPRGITLVIHYSLMKLPDPGYRPRLADDRVGHFLNAVKDFGKGETETSFVRMVNRWRLEKADPRSKLSAPRKQIIFYVEDNVPYEYRPFVEEGIREWNKAFEKIGFRDAIAVRWQQPGEEFDPEDASYSTFRWITTNQTYARSCFRSNPLTGEIFDGDVIFDASWIKNWKDSYALLTGMPTAMAGQQSMGEIPPVEALARGEVISPILAAKRGFGLPGLSIIDDQTPGAARRLAVIPEEWTPLQARLASRAGLGNDAACLYGSTMQMELGLASLALADNPPEGQKPAEAKLPDELIGQGIKEVTMHEVGHSLGLRHNFKASAMLNADQLNDTTITHAKGLAASVMDYLPINLAPKGQKQGDYFSTTIGPYDYWAIEYAYRPIDGNEEAELAKIAARAPEPELIFATDEDAAVNSDPSVNRYDLGADACRFAHDRLILAAELMKDLDSKAVKDGESWAKNRRAFSTLLGQWGNAAFLISQYIGGQYVSRHHKGDKDAKDPVGPVPGDKQREALKLLVSEIFADKAFPFSPQTLRRLGVERWSHWGTNSSATVDVPVFDRFLSIQRIALGQCLSGETLTRVQNQEVQADPATNPLKISEIFRTLSDGLWSELEGPAPDAKEKTLVISTVRRNLQREHLRRLARMVLGDRAPNTSDTLLFLALDGGSSVPPDARSLARLHLRQIQQKIDTRLKDGTLAIDDTTRAHLEESRDKIAKILDASLQATGP